MTKRVIPVVVSLLAFAVLLLSACTAGELEPRFSHQGRLQDEFGVSVPDGDYNFRYRLYHTSTGGTAVFTQTRTVAVDNGLFNSYVGLSQDIDPDIFARPVYMELTVNGEVMTPRQLLYGSPFAFSLVPGATIQGSVPITRTFQTYENTGSAMTVYNRDGTATGGNGLTVVNSATGTYPTQAGSVGALNVIAAGDTASYGEGSYGSRTVSQGYRGSYTKGATGLYAAVFDSDVGITIIGGGGCSGCTTTYPAENSGTEPILAGDFVVAAGVREDDALGIPVLLVRKATSGDEAIVGIATRALRYTTPTTDQYGMTSGGFDPLEGPSAPGGYVTVAVQGLVQARAGSAATPAIGDWLTVVDGDVAIASSAETPVARAMSAPDADGLVWVMFNGR